ncbi:hypothetical protein PILCRDRAFT_819486 [Piloderma croceum F 1598]|uniref:Uncharacterized protein n=1 Tax=Piloderma croceum (strain F 1598) TaxID=765440 RepID=A0A0C3FFP0_PILCF|nr:hypothetical protein PILCRDRAFT_819486 [Piloderma croceum F 1598]
MNFVCQQCKEPLQLDASLVDLAPSAYDMIVASLPQSNSNHAHQPSEAEQLSHLPAHVKSTWERSKQTTSSSEPMSTRAQGKQPQRGSPLPNESFVMLQDSAIRNIPSQSMSTPRKSPSVAKATSLSSTPNSQNLPVPSAQLQPDTPNPTPISHHLRSTLRLFNHLSTRTEIDHPLCAECTQILLTSLQRQLDETKKERDGYIAFEKEVKKEKEKDGQGMSREEAEKKIEKLKVEEKVATENLKEAERDREKFDKELKALEEEEKMLEEDEAEFWRAHNEQQLISAQQASQLAALRAAYASDSATLEKLERTNVYNDAFCIGHDGVFGTINGLRLGRVTGVPVEWAEINAAWGQTLLLLYTIARKLDYTFDSYRLVPMGSFSRIEQTSPSKTTHELYGSGDLHIGRLLHNRRFDFAMVAFLDCLKALIDYIKSQDPTVDFPHQIVKDKIGDVSVKLQFSQEDAWTRALRHVLLALKILLKWATSGSNA